MKKYYYYSRRDSSMEPLDKCRAWDRLSAARYFANRKQLNLKDFLNIYAVSH